MGFKLVSRDIDRVGTVPLYRQIADLITKAIETGELAPGDPIPSEPEMERELGMSRTTIRDGIDELVSAGLVVKRSGTLTRVADRPKLRNLDTARYQAELDLLDQLRDTGGQHPKTSPFVTEVGTDWAGYSIDATYKRGKATPVDAEYLQIAGSEMVIRRNFLKFIDGEPQQIQRSTVPLSIARKTVLEDEDAQPYPGGTIAELYAAGHRVIRIVEEAWARMPTGDERRALQQIQPGPVWDIVRVMFNKDGPIEVSRVITPTATNKLRFTTNLT